MDWNKPNRKVHKLRVSKLTYTFEVAFISTEVSVVTWN